jgi:hypothetical protein
MTKVRRTFIGSARHLVSLSGRFSPGWAGDFAYGLAGRGFNIESAFASRNPRGFWAAEFEMTERRPGMDAASVDFYRLATDPPRAQAAEALPALRLHCYTLLRPTGDNRLHLEIEAPDQMGFLAQLLFELAASALFPVEMRMETSRRLVRGALHLRSLAGPAPSDEEIAAVRQSLDART